ncbi:hypothetical protein H0E87_028642, partial [Populus deltoides]
VELPDVTSEIESNTHPLNRLFMESGNQCNVYLGKFSSNLSKDNLVTIPRALLANLADYTVKDYVADERMQLHECMDECDSKAAGSCDYVP